MTPAEILALQVEILSGPKAAECAPWVVTNDMPKDLNGYAKDQAIAEILTKGRAPKIVSREVGDGAISLALGTPTGPVFMYKLKRIAATDLPVEAPMDEIVPVAIAQQAVESLAKQGFDVGNAGVRAGIDMMVGLLLTAEQASAIKALAEEPEVVTAADVSRALRGPWE